LCWKPKNCIRRVRRVEKFGVNTCPPSRHVRLMGEVLARGEKYPMFEEEPEHCGASLLVTVELLFKARDEIRRLKAKANVEITNAPAVDFGAFGGATGSLPVSRAETLLARWQKRFLTYGGCLDDLQICMAELRREMARATRTLNAE
jgi:hypothetical protein